MSEVARIGDQLRRAFEGDAWHGPSLTRTLSDVDASRAAARPLHGRHTIWEIVLHIAAWDDVVRRRLEGEWISSLPDAEDWPAVTVITEEAWRGAQGSLAEGHRRLREAISRVRDDRLDAPVPEKDYTVYVMLQGIVQHDLYHAGQIALLK